MPKTVKLVGIVNVTPDSFSDGGAFFSTNSAIKHAYQLLQDGADVLDIGAESTRPGAQPITATEEWQRLQPLLHELLSHASPACISVDTRHPETAQKALSLGAHWINDVSAASDDAMLRHVAAHPAAHYVLMHSLGIPANPARILPEDFNPVKQLIEWAELQLKRAESFGISRERIILDPGIGFGKNAAQSWAIIHAASSLQVLGVAVLFGHSRKSFLGLSKEAPLHQRDAETFKVSQALARSGIDYLRVHNVALHDDRL